MERPRIIESTEDEVNAITQALNATDLPERFKEVLLGGLQFIVWLPCFLQKTKISMARLRALLFGKGYAQPHKNKSKPSQSTTEPAVNPDEKDSLAAATQTDYPVPSSPASDEANPAVLEPKNKEKKPGHGRMSHTVYKNCEEVVITLKELVEGDRCPACDTGRLAFYKPGAVIRITGQNFAKVTRYVIKKLRCNCCEALFVAEIPEAMHIGTEKYSASFKSMLALMKYYVAVPFYRQEYFQRLLEFPLPDATQWDLIEQLSGSCYPVFNVLKELAANGHVIHNDDTRLRILEIIKKIKADETLERKGMFTTGFIALYESHQIALFINGTQHAGKNLDELLIKRKLDTPVIQMCDGLKANIPKGLQTILCNCLSHGFRKFVELVDYFSEECLVLLHLLGQVFEHDAKTRHMTPEKRLLYHQAHSQPLMEAVWAYMKRLLDEHRVEPNSELGQAIQYMQKRWPQMCRFLTVAGAPVDNNIVERALKIAIRNRKNAMFYRTCYSASIGGMLTSLIYTCHLANENPLNYLTALQEQQAAVIKAPHDWLPWNYRDHFKVRVAQAA